MEESMHKVSKWGQTRSFTCLLSWEKLVIQNYLNNYFLQHIVHSCAISLLSSRRKEVLAIICDLNGPQRSEVSQVAQFSSVQLLSRVWLFATPGTTACQASLSITNSWNLLKLVSIESVIPSNHLIFCHLLLLLPSIFPGIMVFSNESVFHIRWSKYWSFSITPSNEYLGLISFRIDWFDLLAVQGTLKSLLQHHSCKASVRWHSAFFWSNCYKYT